MRRGEILKNRAPSELVLADILIEEPTDGPDPITVLPHRYDPGGPPADRVFEIAQDSAGL